MFVKIFADWFQYLFIFICLKDRAAEEEKEREERESSPVAQ